MGTYFGNLLSMENKEFKKLLNEIAVKSGFEPAFGGWLKESKDCIIIFALQKSNFGNFYYLNIKVYVNGVFGISYVKNKNLLKDVGNIFSRQPAEYDTVFNLEDQLSDSERKNKLQEFFVNFLIPFCDKALTRKGIQELGDSGQIYVLPAVKEELERMSME